jgi:hypothetical protein
MQSVVDRNVVMWRMTVFCPSLFSHIGWTSTASLSKWRIWIQFNGIVSSVWPAECTGGVRTVPVVTCAICAPAISIVLSAVQICCCSHRPDTITILYNMQMTYIHTGGGNAKQWRQCGRRWWNKVIPPNARVNWIPSVTKLNFTASCQLPRWQLRFAMEQHVFPHARRECLCKRVEKRLQAFFTQYGMDTRGPHHAPAT